MTAQIRNPGEVKVLPIICPTYLITLGLTSVAATRSTSAMVSPAYFTAAPGGCDATIVCKGKNYVYNILDDLAKIRNAPGATQKDKEMFNAIQIVNECYQRGGDFLPVHVNKSHATKFVPENGKIRMPFISLPGLGESAAYSIMNARDEGKIHCIDDLKTNANIGKTLVQLLEDNGALDGMNQTNQMSLFDLM